MRQSLAKRIFFVAFILFILVLLVHYFIFSLYFNRLYLNSMISDFQKDLRQSVQDFPGGGASSSNEALKAYTARTGSPVLVFTDNHQIADRELMALLGSVTLRLERHGTVQVPVSYLGTYNPGELQALTLAKTLKLIAVPLGNGSYCEPLILVDDGRSFTNGPSVLRYKIEAPHASIIEDSGVITQVQPLRLSEGGSARTAAILYDQVKDCLIRKLEIEPYLSNVCAEPYVDSAGSEYRLFSERVVRGDTHYYFVSIRRILFTGQERVYISQLFVVIYCVLAVLLTGSAIILAQYVSRPLIQLSAVTQKISNLDFSEQAKVQGNDELARLAGNINSMAKSLEHELNASKENESRIRALLADLAHEFKTPLGILSFYTELFEKGAYREDPQQYYAVVESEIGKLTTMVNEAIELSKLQSGGWRIQLEPYRFEDILQESLDLFSVRLHNDGFVLETDCADVVVEVDPKRISQVLSNFISNAYKYSDERRRIEIQTMVEGDTLMVYVGNSGDLSDSEKERIWERYYSKAENIKAHLPSNGIGLSIAKSILDSHDSNYGVQQRDGMVYFFFSLRILDDSE